MSKTLGAVTALLVIASLIIGGGLTYLLFPQTITETETIETTILVETAYNDTVIKEDIAKVQATLDKDAIWKAEAIKLAEAEWSKVSYKYLFNFLVSQSISVDEKDDITKVVIRESDVTSFDVDEKDAVVVQELRVYYEDSEGVSKRVTVEVESVIKENEVDDYEFSLA
jgi:hypothetical protein